jgi:hypothetical protein
MNKLEEFLEPYIEFEIRVREQMNTLFGETCGMCTACCCRADVCEETLASPFLKQLLTRQEKTAADLDDRYGWLDTYGCTLEYGRPPVCYTYYCGDLLSIAPDEETRQVITTFGRLIEYVGEEAYEHWHITEIMTPNALEQINIDQLHERLETATEVLDIIEEFFQTGRLTLADRDLMETIGSTEDSTLL